MDEEWIEAYEEAWQAQFQDTPFREPSLLVEMGLLALFFFVLYGMLNQGYPRPVW